ncbi:MAG TPA: sensor domain-containing diguanylate cyclase [Bacillota bacterium]|nr:sensor domain-containing diguanylate cyclase [Clostridiaceae bacterium]HNR04535.1 sensor domain-containing diguanylate cyclase [Bacillota bacterium]HNT03907.1 sensor domain-containing diguanylate cyclase [Bacillota bacterium]HNU80887.1 sensor domain-containing diguanylate cyclase [Bacillota bacterium]HPX69995.1 sensor domain-containing diguanylate cyclase [Bacillota bacterium]
MSINSTSKSKQKELIKKLRSSNILLKRYSMITDSIMKITSEVFSSGEIDYILQTIMDKAIEIIPGAQRGSILIYNGSVLEFKASRGYDSSALENLKLSIEEVFQYNSEDFFEPCIVSNQERFNREHLPDYKYEILQKGLGINPKSTLSCAFQVDNKFQGIINLDNMDDNTAFRKEDKPLIKHLAVQIGIALKNARQIEKILFLSRHDSLTGIYNRCYFEELLMHIMQTSKASASVFSLAMLDINNLKYINDTYGHEAGDLMLKKFAQCVNEIITGDDIFARYGGDEFAIIFKDNDNIQAANKINNIRQTLLNLPFTYCGKTIAPIGFGCGIVQFPADGSEFQDFMRLADISMYQDKKKSKKPVI